jgi:malate synthase
MSVYSSTHVISKPLPPHSYVKTGSFHIYRRDIAVGGMSAQIPTKGDSAANDAAINKVKADK